MMFTAYQPQMYMSADAWFAPACQSAQMDTESMSAPIRILDTALLAVSFLSEILLGIVVRIVRIIIPNPAKP